MCRSPQNLIRQGGFSLLEVLVAFTVLALLLGILLQIFSTALQGVTLSKAYTQAALLADSKLQAVGIDPELINGTTGTEDEQYHWRVSLQPDTSLELPMVGQKQQTLYWVQVDVWWDEGYRERRFALKSLRLLSE